MYTNIYILGGLSCNFLWELVGVNRFSWFQPPFKECKNMVFHAQAETPHPQRCDALCLADVTWCCALSGREGYQYLDFTGVGKCPFLGIGFTSPKQIFVG